MKRRTLLAGLGAGVAGTAGCLDSGSAGRSPTPSSEPEPPSCDSSAQRRIALGETASVPPDAAISIDVDVERATPTSEEPALLKVRLTNEGEEREIAWPADARCHPFNRDRGFSDPRGIRLHYRTETPEDRLEPCWTRDAVPHERNPGWNGYGCSRVTVETGETITYPIEVWDDFRIEGYMPTGTYRFRAHPTTVPEADVVEWWFEIEVENA